MDDVSVSEDRIHYLLTGLKPHTQYAIYVKTFTIATYRYGAKSDILYFKTLPDRKYFSNYPIEAEFKVLFLFKGHQCSHP